MGNKREMALINKDASNFDKILAYHINPEAFPLTPLLLDIQKRWNEILTLRLNKWTRPMIVKKWEKDYGISPAQAYIDIRNSESLYGNVLKADKEGSRVLWLMRVEDFLLRAVQKGDMKAEAAAHKLLAEYSDFKADDNPEFNPAKLENNEIEFDIPKEQLELLREMASKGVQDFNKLSVIDVDYEDIKDGADKEK